MIVSKGLILHWTQSLTCLPKQKKFLVGGSRFSSYPAVRRGSHQGGSLQNGLRDEQTCGTTLASAYVLRRLSATWSQLQVKERSPSGSEC